MLWSSILLHGFQLTLLVKCFYFFGRIRVVIESCLNQKKTYWYIKLIVIIIEWTSNIINNIVSILNNNNNNNNKEEQERFCYNLAWTLFSV